MTWINYDAQVCLSAPDLEAGFEILQKSTLSINFHHNTVIRAAIRDVFDVSATANMTTRCIFIVFVDIFNSTMENKLLSLSKHYNNIITVSTCTP